MQFIKCDLGSWSARLAGAILFVAMVSLTVDCYGQRPRGLFHRLGAGQSHYAAVEHAGSHARPLFVLSPHHAYPHTQTNHAGDWRWAPSFYSGDPTIPKFIGGFHISQYYNLGAPSGDIGPGFNGTSWKPK